MKYILNSLTHPAPVLPDDEYVGERLPSTDIAIETNNVTHFCEKNATNKLH